MSTDPFAKKHHANARRRSGCSCLPVTRSLCAAAHRTRGQRCHHRHQPQSKRCRGLLGEPAGDRSPPLPVATQQHKDAEEQEDDAKEEKLPRAAKALVDAAEQQSQQVHEQQEDEGDPQLLPGRATTEIGGV